MKIKIIPDGGIRLFGEKFSLKFVKLVICVRVLMSKIKNSD